MTTSEFDESTTRAARTTARALDTKGTSESAAVVSLVRRILQTDNHASGVLIDVGCGTGRLYAELRGCFARYVGIDVVQYPGFPSAPDASFQHANLDDNSVERDVAGADVVCCLETIEHVENPRALVRAVDRMTKPGGRVIISTPNQLSLLSKICLVTRNEFVHFQERPGLYPAHLTALLECDLHRLSREIGWMDVKTLFSGAGRIPGTHRAWPRGLASQTGWRGRAFSDNIVLTARKPS